MIILQNAFPQGRGALCSRFTLVWIPCGAMPQMQLDNPVSAYPF